MKFIEQYPIHLQNDDNFKLIQEVLEKELNLSKDDLRDLFNQFFVTSATWGLWKWELLAGLEPHLGDTSDIDIETRRSNVLAALRSRSTTTVEKIRVISESYANGTCEVIEDNANSTFYIKFTGVRGIPKRIDELRKSITAIKPAHLAFDFIFSYLIWDEFDAYNHTWDEWDATNITWDGLETYIKKRKGGLNNA